MKILKIFYLSLLIIGTSLTFAYCLKIIFFPSNNNSLASNSKSILETNTKYFDEIYSEFEKMNQSKKDLLTKKQFFNIIHCYFVLSQLKPIDYGEMIIYILEKNPLLIENFILESDGDFIKGMNWLDKLNTDLFYKKPLHRKENQSTLMKKFEDIKSKLRTSCKDIENVLGSEYVCEFRNDIKAIFNTTSLNIHHLQNFRLFCYIRITDEDIFIRDKSILMKPALFYAIDYIKRNWSDTLSTDMSKNVFSFEFTTPEGTFSYFYIALYSI